MSTRVLIVEARFYGDIADELARGAEAYLAENGVAFERLAVPGAFEIPAAISMAALGAEEPGFDGYIALGCVIRGETTHYDYVCEESARGLRELAVNHRVPIGYGILTVENADQAWARASVERKDKGRDAAEACLRMIEIRRRFVLS